MNQGMASKEFAAVMAADKELNRLDAAQWDVAAAKAVLLRIVSGGGITAAQWAMINAGLSDWSDKVRQTFLSAESDTEGADKNACATLSDELAVAFRPLRRLAASAGGVEPNVGCGPPAHERFGSAWLARICSIAAREGNVTIQAAMRELPLALVCELYVLHVARERPELVLPAMPPDFDQSAEIMARAQKLWSDWSDKSDKSNGGSHEGQS